MGHGQHISCCCCLTTRELQAHLCLLSLFIVPDMPIQDINGSLVNHAGHAAQFPTMQHSLMVRHVVQVPHVVAAQPSTTPGAYVPTVQVVRNVQIVPIMPTGYVQPVPLMPSVQGVPAVHSVPRVYEVPTVPAEAQTQSPRWNELPNSFPVYQGN